MGNTTNSFLGGIGGSYLGSSPQAQRGYGSARTSNASVGRGGNSNQTSNMLQVSRSKQQQNMSRSEMAGAMAQQNRTYPTFFSRNRSNFGDLYGNRQSTFDDRERARKAIFQRDMRKAETMSIRPGAGGRDQKKYDRLMAKVRQSYDSYYDNFTSSFDR